MVKDEGMGTDLPEIAARSLSRRPKKQRAKRAWRRGTGDPSRSGEWELVAPTGRPEGSVGFLGQGSEWHDSVPAGPTVAPKAVWRDGGSWVLRTHDVPQLRPGRCQGAVEALCRRFRGAVDKRRAVVMPAEVGLLAVQTLLRPCGEVESATRSPMAA